MKNKNLFWGLVFLAAGVAVVLGQMDIIELSSYAIIVSIIGGVLALTSLIRRNFFVAMMMLSYVLWINRSYVDVLGRLNGYIFLVAALLGIGLTLLFGTNKYNKYNRYGKGFHYKPGTFRAGEYDKEMDTVVSDDDAYVNVYAKMSGTSQYLYSKNLTRVNIESKMGAVQVYFENAKPNPEGCVISIDCTLAGVELYIPRSWKVINNVSAVLGGVEETPNYNDVYEAGEVILEGSTTLGGVKVVYI